MSAEHLFRFAKDKILSDPVRGLVLLEKAAKQGSRNALYELIRAYQGFRPELREYTDHEKAYALCREYCAEGDGHVFFLLAEMYRLGLSVERNEKEARRWYLKAAKRNDIRAMEMLALFFQREYALFWYKKILSFPPSAENLPNRQNAARALGDLYRFGIGVEKNFETAASWYVKCVELRGEKSPLAALYRENGLSQDAVRVFSEAAEEGESEAMYALGSMYRMGEGIKQDKKTAFSWFEKAAVSDLRACDMLGDMCRTGEGVPLDPAAAIYWYRMAKSGYGLSRIAHMYLAGEGLEKNVERGKRYLVLAAGQRDLKAKLELAELYLSTKPRTTKNMRQAMRHLYRIAQIFSSGDDGAKCQEGEKARERLVQIAHAGSVDAMYLLGRIYMTVMEDSERRGKAKSWLSGAASEGHVQSAELLKEIFGGTQEESCELDEGA